MDTSRRRSSKPLKTIKNGEDVVQYFYKCMLTYIVDKWEDDVKHPSDYIPKSKKTYIIPNKNYMQACNEIELDSDSIKTNPETEEPLIKTGSRIRGVKNKKTRRFEKSRSRKFSSFSLDNLDTAGETHPSSPPPPPTPFQEEHVMVRFSNGNIYNGPVFKKKFHGKGKYRWSDGSTYIGEFSNGEITGKGKFYYNDLSTYEGDVYKGFPHGYGKKFAPESPSAYCGQWKIGKKHGPGWVIYSEDNWYEGNWKSDQMHGNGIRCYPDGSKYQGNFDEGKRHGTGCAILNNNDLYVGDWVNGRRSGYGEYIWKAFLNTAFSIPVQNKYIGHWVKDRMHGSGQLYFGTTNGTRYIGEFFKNFKHGGGLLICDNGDVIQYANIFANDKPVHLLTNGAIDKSLHISETCIDHCEQVFKKIENGPNAKNDIHLQTENKFQHHLDKKVFLLPSSNYGKDSGAKIDLCQLKINEPIPRRTFFSMPINITAESIKLDSFIQKMCEAIYIGSSELDLSEAAKVVPRSWKDVGVEMSPKPQVKYSYQEIYNIEEKALRRAIHINLRRLKCIYRHYSLVGCLKNLPYETLMNRLFLWQMYRDCKISEKGISLTSIDVLLAEDCVSFSESIHDPFENIYFWQFLTSLLHTAWEIYGSKTIKYIFEGRSILEEIFTKFLNEDIFPNAGHHIGCALFDYKDIIPIKSAYNWYKSIEEPMTIKTFVINIFSLDKKESFTFEPIPEEFYLKSGTNISIGNDVAFLADEEPKYGIGPRKEKIMPNATKCNKKKLRFLHDLGNKIIYKKIRTVVPGIFTKQECFNHGYKLCFLEFYEILLLCSQTMLKKNEYKLKKKIAKISEMNDNALLKTITTTSKKSKQYRKSASHHSIAKHHVS